ncbi:uncharacterized protein LOC128548919 [Mercenaria mercenaria]|uniref:uncharacterized protein LOC128548919 n=1 Tax=Mercenaria mercenaria TaxID=6596 RepID=UPI00234F7956|nr:uncharacterized protein LOC128548919 [Mercenaria mercenaria]
MEVTVTRLCMELFVRMITLLTQVKHVQWFLNSFEETKTVKFVPYSKVKMFSYRNRQHKSTIIHCIKNHCSELFKKHLNLKHISPSPFKEIKGEFTNEACIVMHISKKELIPVGQGYLPRELEYLESECFPVDVRSTTCKYNFVYRADDFFQNLRMGCKVYSPIANGCFTLGGFVIGPNKNIFFVACAHSLLMEETVKEMVECGRSVHTADIESHKVCFQPEHKSKFHCGTLTKAVFKTGTADEPGVDCALIQCCSERKPVCGYFPDSPGFFNILDLNKVNNKKQYYDSPSENKNVFISGESLDQNQIPENPTVYKFGIRTGWTEGTLVSTFDSELNFSGFALRVCMLGQFEVLGKDNWPFALEGDSGAWVFIRDRDGSFKVIGMVIGFEGNVTTVTPISAVLDSLGLNKESIMSLPGSESVDTDSFEDDDDDDGPQSLRNLFKLHYEDEIRKVIPEPDIGFGITGFNMH